MKIRVYPEHPDPKSGSAQKNKNCIFFLSHIILIFLFRMRDMPGGWIETMMDIWNRMKVLSVVYTCMELI